MTAVDWATDLDVDLDAVVPCCWTGCQDEPIWIALMACEAGAVHHLPLCDAHLAKVAEWYSRLEQLLALGLDIRSLPHQSCLPHLSPVRMRGSRPL